MELRGGVGGVEDKPMMAEVLPWKVNEPKAGFRPFLPKESFLSPWHLPTILRKSLPTIIPSSQFHSSFTLQGVRGVLVLWETHCSIIRVPIVSSSHLCPHVIANSASFTLRSVPVWMINYMVALCITWREWGCVTLWVGTGSWQWLPRVLCWEGVWDPMQLSKESPGDR